MKVVFNFGGFYNSFYNIEIDYIIYEDSENNTIEPDLIDFKKLHIAISKHIVEQFNEFLSDEYSIVIDLKFDSLESPKYYNYATDKIILNVSKKDMLILDNLVLSDSDVVENLKETINDVTTSKSGYIPFYNYDEVLNKINKDNKEIYYQCLFDTLIALNKDGYTNTTLEMLHETIINNI